jgi:hypothetical protein
MCDAAMGAEATAGAESNFVAVEELAADAEVRFLSRGCPYFPVKARSVPPLRVTRYCSGVRSLFHSSSLFTTRPTGSSAGLAGLDALLAGLLIPLPFAASSPPPGPPDGEKATASEPAPRVVMRRNVRRVIPPLFTIDGPSRIYEDGVSGANVLERGLHPVEVRPEREDADAEMEGALRRRPRKVNAAAGVDRVEKAAVQGVEGGTLDAPWPQAEGKAGEDRFGRDLHLRDSAELPGGPSREVELLVQVSPEGGEAV